MSNDGITILRVSQELMERCEEIAAARRVATRKNCLKSEIAREALALGLKTLARRKPTPSS